MLPRRHRLTRPAEFSAVLRGGARTGSRRAATRALVVHRRDGSTGGPVRVGFVVSKAVGGSVVRHRVTRRLRALVAARLGTFPEGTDVVVRANPAAADADSAALGAHLDQALAKVSR